MAAEITAESSSPQLSVDDQGIATLTFDDPDRNANVLAEGVMRCLAEQLDDIREGVDTGKIRGLLVRSGKGASFIVGADIEAIGRIESPDEGAQAARLGQAIFQDLEDLPVPTVAAIHGTCMGGGTELALACRYRLASDHPKTRIALPEVQLGIIPAWGGTTRLPRLVGLQAALDLILTGKTADPRKAKRIGLVEEVFPHPIFQEKAREFLLARIQEGPVSTGARRGLMTRLMDDTLPGRRIVLAMARKQVRKQTGGHYPAPLRILNVIRASAGQSLEKGLELEAEAAGELLASSVSKNLVHVFHLREAARKGTGVASEVEPVKVETLGVVGAGVMGGGIAQLASYHGLRVRLKDINHEAVADGLQHARDLFDKGVKRRKLSRREADQAMELISGGLEYTGFGQAELVVEAVVEKMEVKRIVFRELEERVADDCILATNTSSLSVDEMAEGLRHPERVCGLHFFNPVHKMPLVEVVKGRRTDDRSVASAYALALALGKVPVVVGDGPGFLVNRILGPYLNEAGHLLADGASVEAVDRAAKDFGMPMGPLRLLDEVGIDVARHAGEVLYRAFGDRLTPSAPLVAIGESERLGKKGGLGFYRHDGKKEEVDPGIYEALGSAVPASRVDVPKEEIRARLVVSMITEAARVLADGIAASAADVDLAMIMGTGFAPFRGGLLRFADEVHPRTVVERCREYQEKCGPRFAPPDLLVELARDDRTFYEAFPATDEAPPGSGG
jgi:3-hydroxyacyl-CoA dehydrogenase / enoyl-CoA hydratase / 3-hydroxybutyryl-CoA epimerase